MRVTQNQSGQAGWQPRPGPAPGTARPSDRQAPQLGSTACSVRSRKSVSSPVYAQSWSCSESAGALRCAPLARSPRQLPARLRRCMVAAPAVTRGRLPGAARLSAHPGHTSARTTACPIQTGNALPVAATLASCSTPSSAAPLRACVRAPKNEDATEPLFQSRQQLEGAQGAWWRPRAPCTEPRSTSQALCCASCATHAWTRDVERWSTTTSHTCRAQTRCTPLRARRRGPAGACQRHAEGTACRQCRCARLYLTVAAEKQPPLVTKGDLGAAVWTARQQSHISTTAGWERARPGRQQVLLRHPGRSSCPSECCNAIGTINQARSFLPSLGC